jgi:hypothetical protein
MPFNVKSSQDINGIEVLRFPALGAPVKSVVLDLTDDEWPAPTDKTLNFRFLIPAGTLLMLSATNPTQYVKYDGTTTAKTIKGVLASSIDAWVNTTASDEPAPMFFHQVVFATEAIVDFTLYASQLVNDLPTTLFQ